MARPESKPKTLLAARLREIRRFWGDIDREELAKELGVSKSTIAAYERGDSEPTASILALYQVKFGISLEWLITGNGVMLSGADVPVGEVSLADIRRIVWNIAETYWEKFPRRTKPEDFADKFVEVLDYLVSRSDLKDDVASEVVLFDVERLKRTSGQGGE